jgi:transposase
MSKNNHGYLASTRSNKAARFDKNFILMVLKEFRDGIPRKNICLKYGMCRQTLNDWLNKYDSEQYRRTKKKCFPMQKRTEIVRLVLEGKLSKAEASSIYQVQRKTLNKWIVDYNRRDKELIEPNPQIMVSPIEDLSFEQLSQQLAEARLKITALETMIDIAETQFKIPIRKKRGAKQ